MTKLQFNNIIDHIWSNRKEIGPKYDFQFDYPDYGELPKKISSRLSGDAVDAMQDIYFLFEIKDVKVKDKRSFAKLYRQKLNYLGESIR